MNFSDIKGQNHNNILNKNGAMNNEITKDNTSSTFIGKEDYSNRNNMLLFINNNNSSFLEKFELNEFISSGSSGYVFKGIYKHCKKPVAVKFLINGNKKENNDSKNRKSQKQEIEISKKFHNKNITEVYDYFKKDKISYLVLELGKYGDIGHFLKNLLKRKSLSETALVYFGKQILEGLKYMHGCKVAHMDIKPDNIILGLNLQAKITDFSISCSYSDFNPEDLVKFPFVGTGKYIAPEIINREHMKIKDTEKIDIYSFGVTLYYLFYGEYPYGLNGINSRNYKNISKNIKENKLEFPEKKSISNIGKDFLEKILDKDYNKRLNIKQALGHPWIQGAQIIIDEKEKIGNQECFLIQLITDNIKYFNEYIKKKK